MFNIEAIQLDFPILQKKIHTTKRLVYLDNAATSQKPHEVIDAISNYYMQQNANVHRGIHQLGDESTQLYHASRKTVANFFGAQVEVLITVRNTTEAINQVAYTWGEAQIQSGDVILCTEMEHHSDLVPWQELAHRKTAQLEFVPVNEAGQLDMGYLAETLKKHADLGKPIKIFCFTHVSNTLGTLNPVSEVVQLIKQFSPETKILVDGAQAAPHLQINFHELEVDFYAVSAHKMLGPMGIGGLFIKKAILLDLKPFLFGGGMINEVSLTETSFAEDLEERFEAGTPDVAGIVGWAAACDYLSKIGMKELLQHDQELVKYTLEQLKHFPQIKVIGMTENEDLIKRVSSVAFIYQGVHAHDVGQILDSEGVAVRSGHHCTMPLHRKFHWQATVRVSFQLYNSKADIDELVKALHKVQHVLGK